MSSSSGNVVTLDEVLQVYTPEMVRWIFAHFKSNVDFSISFDLDVIKVYEDYDRQELLASGKVEGNPKKVAMAKRVFQLSQLDRQSDDLPPFRPKFRHLTNILQIHQHSLDRTRKYYQSQGKIQNDRDDKAFQERARCALFWLEHYAPEDFKFSLNQTAPPLELDDKQKRFLIKLKEFFLQGEEFPTDEKLLHENLYQLIKEVEAEPKEIFPLLYRILINKERGPKLASFVCSVGKEKTLSLLNSIAL